MTVLKVLISRTLEKIKQTKKEKKRCVLDEAGSQFALHLSRIKQSAMSYSGTCMGSWLGS